jgi:hypothetical protein
LPEICPSVAKVEEAKARSYDKKSASSGPDGIVGYKVEPQMPLDIYRQIFRIPWLKISQMPCPQALLDAIATELPVVIAADCGRTCRGKQQRMRTQTLSKDIACTSESNYKATLDGSI